VNFDFIIDKTSYLRFCQKKLYFSVDQFYGRRSPATGKKLEWGQILIFRVENGKIVEMWEDWDALGLMQQLGMELKPKEEE
jgi:hypothetical protein